MTRVDPYKHKERWEKWKNKTSSQIEGINKSNSDLIKEYLFDMESGLNVSTASKKGSRSYIRLNVLSQRLVFLAKEFEKRFGLNSITEVNEQQLFGFFMDIRNGKILKQNGEKFQSVRDLVKDFKAFWHWYQKKNRKRGIILADITLDLDSSGEKPKWVYLTEDQIKKLSNQAKYEHKVLIWFLFDSGIRAPTELMNIRVSDFYNDFTELNIREEISKTFGRRIKLLLCPELIKEYVKNKQLNRDDYLFKASPQKINKYLKRLSKNILGEGESLAGEKYSNLTMYDFRHCSCCYWLPRYKSESALKYRFGWKKTEKIHYYSEFLGMKDTISEDDMLVDVTKTEIEKQLQKTQKENDLLQERIKNMEIQMEKIMVLTDKLHSSIEI